MSYGQEVEPVICKEELLSCEEEEESLSGNEQEEKSFSGDEQKEKSFSGDGEEEESLSGDEQEEKFYQKKKKKKKKEQEEKSFSSDGEEEESFSSDEEEEWSQRRTYMGGRSYPEWMSFVDGEKEEWSYGEGEEEEICRLSHIGEPHTLSRHLGTELPGGCFAGGDNELTNDDDEIHYHCTTCDVEFHEDCHQMPRKMTHPYHPQHPLIFSVRNDETGIIYDSNWHDCTEETEIIGVGIPDHGNIFDNCTWCGENHVKDYEFFYRCSICNFCLCALCSRKYPLPTITNPKNHHHSLIFLPRPLLVPCDACGLVKRSKPSYACLQCNYVVHRGCVDLPRVIKITRHPHRLFYTPFLSPTISSSCRICYQTVDIKYGQYICNHDDCSYVAHSKCATHKNVWDGEELEWEPDGETGDVASFKKVGDGLIQYFSHKHHLKLEKYNSTRDADKQCEACVLHIDSQDYYNCVQCDFFLHEVCANLPQKLDHALHHHPLFLETGPPDGFDEIEIDDIKCKVCARLFSGFRYTCSEKNCFVKVDVGCILVPDCFTHKSHEHPLFIPIFGASDKQEDSIPCDGCNLGSAFHYLQCTLCEFALCYTCATIPDKLHNKYDALPLSLCYGELGDETYWCEVCEEKLDPSEWFYTCTKPYITIHRICAFASSCYMKPGCKYYTGVISRVKVLCNSSNTRPICYQCKRRCSSSVYFKFSDGKVVCGMQCLRSVR